MPQLRANSKDGAPDREGELQSVIPPFWNYRWDQASQTRDDVVSKAKEGGKRPP